jgi:hypothetical protein
MESFVKDRVGSRVTNRNYCFLDHQSLPVSLLVVRLVVGTPLPHSVPM